MTRPARILWTTTVPQPDRRAARPRRRRRAALTLLLGLGVAALIALLGRCDRAGARAPLDGQNVTLLHDGTWLALGGESAGASSDGWIEDPASGARVALPAVLVHARAGHTATVLADGRVLVWGGRGPDGRLVDRAEVFDPAARASAEWPGRVPAPRAHHTTTLLPSGALLVAGGVGAEGDLVPSVETWDLREDSVTLWPTALPTPRQNHAATHDGNGHVWLSGGADPASGAAAPDVRLDPETLSAEVEGAPPAAPGPPAVGRTWPRSGSREVSPDAVLALAVDPPLAPATVTPDTVVLVGPLGAVAVRSVAAEGGRLLLVTPREALSPGEDFALTLDGARGAAGRSMRPFTLSFSTSEPEAAGPVGAGAGAAPTRPAAPVAPGLIGDPLAGPPPADPAQDDEPWEWHGPRQAGRPWSPWQELPPRQAPPGVTALSGQVIDLAGRPLADVTVALGQTAARTDPTGRFLLALPELLTGAETEPGELVVDGRTVGRPGREYGRFEIGVRLARGRTTVLPYTIWLPALDVATARTLPPGPLPADLVLTSPRLPGLEIHLPAGSRLRDHEGRPVERVTLTPVPPDRPPFPLPAGIQTPVYFTVQPGGAYVAHPGHAPARIVYPNFTDERRAPRGARAAFWHYEPDEAAWRVYGEGSVTPGGEQIVPDAGVGVYEFTGAMVNVPSMAPPALAPVPGSRAWAGDPVDLATGLFVLTTTDLFLPGVPALALTRTYRPEDPAVRPFGRGTNHAYGVFLWSANEYQEADLVLPDGGRVHYVRTSPGTSFSDAEFAEIGSPTAFSGSTLRWNLPAAGWDLRLRDGTVLRFGMNAPLQWIQDRVGNRVTLHRANGSPVGPIVRVAASNGRWLELDYDTASRVSRVRDSAGRSVQYGYDAADRLVVVTNPLGGVTRYSYDGAHRMLTIADARGIVFLQNAYDGTGRVTSQTVADGGVHTFAYALAAGGRVTECRVTDPAGTVRRVTFDVRGHSVSDTAGFGTPLARTVTFDRDPASSRIVGAVDPLGRRTAFQYDALGNLTRATALDGTATPAAWSMAYEPQFSRPVTITDPLGRTATLGHDALGNVVTLTDPTGRTVTIGYGAEGQPVTVATPAGTTRYAWNGGDLTAVTDPLGRQWTHVVDAAGRPTMLTDPLGRTTRLTWDPLNRLLERLDAAGGRTAFAYDATGNLLGATDPRGYTTAYAYDAMDRRVTRTDPLGRGSRREYDAAGRLTTVTDRLGGTTSIAWDALHRPSSVTDADGMVTTYEWDAGDRLVRAADRSGPIARQYDLLDRLVAETSAAGTVQYAYDLTGQRVRLTAPGQPPVEYTYDAAGRLTAVAGNGGTTTLEVDPAGRPVRLTRPTGLVTDVTWDAASRVTRLAWRHGATVLGELTQGYDAAGQPVLRGGPSAAIRLPAPFGGAIYDAADRLLAVGPRALSWDAEGRLTEVDDPASGRTQYTWNARGQLVGVDGPSTALAFGYDALHRRLETADGAISTDWLHDGLTPLVERRQGALHATRLVGPELDRVWARTGPAGRRWPIDDMLGSPIAWVDDAGAVVTRATYGPFGDSSFTGEAQPIGFTGREQDRPDLLHFRARPYVPSLQRFISEDPIEEPGAHHYTYAGNAPLGGVDPLGLYTIIIHGGPPFWRPSIVNGHGSNRGLNTMADFLRLAGEPIGVFTAGQLDAAVAAAAANCRAGKPVHLIGHSMGGATAIDVALSLARQGILVSDISTIDAFRPRVASLPYDITALNFYQTQGMLAGGPLGGRKTNPLASQQIGGLGGNAHSTITSASSVQIPILGMVLGHQVPCTFTR